MASYANDFDVDGVQCRALPNWLIKVGIGLPKSLTFTVKMRNGEEREEAVLRHAKFAAAKSAAASSMDQDEECEPRRAPIFASIPRLRPCDLF